MSDSVQPHRRQPTRLRRPWDSPGKNTGVGCHFLLQNVRLETIKVLEENIGKTLSDINHSKILYDPPPRLMEIKAKINKWDLIKLKSCCTMKENISKIKRQLSEWEKIIANEATDKEFNLKNIQAAPAAQFQKNK